MTSAISSAAVAAAAAAARASMPAPPPSVNLAVFGPHTRAVIRSHPRAARPAVAALNAARMDRAYAHARNMRWEGKPASFLISAAALQRVRELDPPAPGEISTEVALTFSYPARLHVDRNEWVVDKGATPIIPPATLEVLSRGDVNVDTFFVWELQSPLVITEHDKITAKSAGYLHPLTNEWVETGRYDFVAYVAEMTL